MGYNEINTMIQDQLVDYISSQMKLGVSRDAIKNALVSAGWVAGDVEDTLKKVAGVAGPADATKAMPTTAASSASAMGKPSDPQMIRVSDLVSASAMTSSTAQGSQNKTTTKIDPSKLGGKIVGNTFQADSTKPTMSGGGSKAMMIGIIVLAIVAIGCAGAAYYFYAGNSGLASKVDTLTTQSTSLTSQLSSLQAQVAASGTVLGTQVASLTTANAELAMDLSFYAVPAGATGTGAAVPLPITVKGWLSGGGKSNFVVTTNLGAKIGIGNSFDAKIMPELKPLAGHVVAVTGTYVPGSDLMTAVSVLDMSPAPAASSTPAPAMGASGPALLIAPTSTATSTTSAK